MEIDCQSVKQKLDAGDEFLFLDFSFLVLTICAQLGHNCERFRDTFIAGLL